MFQNIHNNIGGMDYSISKVEGGIFVTIPWMEQDSFVELMEEWVDGGFRRDARYWVTSISREGIIDDNIVEYKLVTNRTAVTHSLETDLKLIMAGITGLGGTISGMEIYRYGERHWDVERLTYVDGEIVRKQGDVSVSFGD